MEERAFDALQKGTGAIVLLGSTILLILIIIAGGMFMRYKEMEYRRNHEQGDRNPQDPTPGHPVV
jgi:hypothetical protein